MIPVCSTSGDDTFFFGLQLHVLLTFDFCDVLIFPTIAFAKVHVSAESGFPTAIARPSQNCTLVVETSVPVTGTITVEVDSSEPSSRFL